MNSRTEGASDLRYHYCDRYKKGFVPSRVDNIGFRPWLCFDVRIMRRRESVKRTSFEICVSHIFCSGEGDYSFTRGFLLRRVRIGEVLWFFEGLGARGGLGRGGVCAIWGRNVLSLKRGVLSRVGIDAGGSREEAVSESSASISAASISYFRSAL